MTAKKIKEKYLYQKGIATLPTVFAFIILIVALTVGVAALSLTEGFMSLGSRQSSQALIYAEAGARDALIRIARNKKYVCASADCYSIDFVTGGCSTKEGCAEISVSAGTGSSGDPKIIASKGQVNSNTRKIQVTVFFDSALNGRISTTTWQELSD
jgi:hypothetical protein